MTLDQKIQVWMVIGTWLAGIGTFAAVVVALYLAKRVEKVSLSVRAGLREMIRGDGTAPEDLLGINVTNLGERTVTIQTVGWVVGKGKCRRFAMQPVACAYSDRYPMELAHGKTGNFLVSFQVAPNWLRDFATGFVKDLSDKSLRTLRVQIHTSVAQTITVQPERELLDELKKAGSAA